MRMYLDKYMVRILGRSLGNVRNHMNLGRKPLHLVIGSITLFDIDFSDYIVSTVSIDLSEK